MQTHPVKGLCERQSSLASCRGDKWVKMCYREPETKNAISWKKREIKELLCAITSLRKEEKIVYPLPLRLFRSCNGLIQRARIRSVFFRFFKRSFLNLTDLPLILFSSLFLTNHIIIFPTNIVIRILWYSNNDDQLRSVICNFQIRSFYT